MSLQELKTITDLTDEFINTNFVIRKEIHAQNSAVFLNLTNSVSILLPKRFGYGCYYFNSKDAKDRLVQKPTFSYAIYTEKNEKCPDNLEEDLKIFNIFDKISKRIASQISTSTEQPVIDLHKKILKKNQNILSIKGFRSVENEKDPSKTEPGKHALYLTLEAGVTSKNPTMINDGATRKPLDASSIIVNNSKGGKPEYKTGNYLCVIQIRGIVFVQNPTLSIGWTNCQYFKSENETRLKLASDWQKVIEREAISENVETVVSDEPVVSDETVVSNLELDEYEKAMESINLTEQCGSTAQ